MRKGKRGSALVMVIWTITILSLLVISFAMEAKLQSYVNVFMRERVRLENLVENGTVLAEVIVVGAPDVSAETEDEDLEELDFNVDDDEDEEDEEFDVKSIFEEEGDDEDGFNIDESGDDEDFEDDEDDDAFDFSKLFETVEDDDSFGDDE